jgi:hypothetical protein
MGAQGVATLDFGAFPGNTDTSLAVADATILAGSLVEAWIWPLATTDHTADEHIVEPLNVFAGNVVAGVGFTIYLRTDNRMSEPVETPPGANSLTQAGAAVLGKTAQPGVRAALGGSMPMAYGKWSIAWAWN